MGSVVDQLRLSIWKHVTIRKRQPVILALELLWPVVVFLIVAGVRQVIPPKERPDCVYNARALPSAGMMPFMQSFVCNLDNACQRISTYEEIPSYRNSQIATVVRHLQPLVDKPEIQTVLTELRHSMHLATLAVTSLSKPQVKAILAKEYTVGDFFKNQTAAQDAIANSLLLSPQTARSLLASKVNFGQLLVAAQKSPMDIICDAKTLAKILQFPDDMKPSDISSKLCNFNVAEKWPSLLMVMVEVDVSHVCNTVKVVLESFGDKELAEVVTAIADIVDVVQGIPIISSLGQIDLASFNTASLTDIARYLSNALEMFDSLKSSKIDFSFLNQILKDVRKVLGHNELLNHAISLGEHVGKLADMWINKKPQNENLDGLKLKFEDLLKNNDSFKTALLSIQDVTDGDVDHLLDAQVKLDKLDNLSKFSSGLEICNSICSSKDELESVLDLQSASNPQLKLALCRPEVCPLNVREDIQLIKNRIARNLRGFEQKFNTSSLALMVDDIMHHTKHISETLGPFLRKTYPAADFFWKSTTAIMSVLGMPQWNTSHALMSLIPIVESFPTYMPPEAKIPFLNLMSAAQLSVGFASRISEKAAELDEILLAIVKSNSESLKHMLSLGPSIINSLVTVFSQESTHKVLLDKPANLSAILCHDSALHSALNLPKEIDTEALQFFLCSLPVAEMTTNLYQSITTDEAIQKIESVMMSSVFNSTDVALRENIHSFFEQLANLVESVKRIVAATHNWNTFFSTLEVPGQNLTENDWKSVRNQLEAAKYQTILSLYASLLGRNLDGLYFNSALDGDKTMAVLLDIMNALSEETGAIPAYFLENVADNWHEVIRVFLHSLKDADKRKSLLEVQSWSNITCLSDDVEKYLAIALDTNKEKFTRLLCNMTSYVENEILGVVWTERPLFRTIFHVAEGRERDKRKKLSWQSTLDDVSSIFKKYSPIVVKMIQSSQEFESLASEAKEVFGKLPPTDIVKFCVNVLSISFKFVDKQLEPLDLWAWKNLKGLASVLELVTQTANTQLERAIARGRLEVADVMLDLPTFTEMGHNIVRFLPHLLEGFTDTLLKDFGDFVTRLTEVNTSLIPCGGVSIADLVKFSAVGDNSLRNIENIVCNQSRVMLSEIIKLPLSFNMLWKVRDANKGKNIEINWDGFSNDLKSLTDNVANMITFDGEVFTEVEGFNMEDLVNSWENMKSQFRGITPIAGARLALTALDAGMPFIINATAVDEMNFSSMVELLGTSSKEPKVVGYQIFSTFRAVLKTTNVLMSDFNQFLIKLPAVNATLKDLVGATTDLVLVNLLENMPDYMSVLVHTVADSKFSSMLERFLANGTFDFSTACYENSPIYDVIVIPANVSMDRTQVLDTVCKAMSDPKHYFAVEPYVDTWISRTIDKIVNVWKHQSPLSINVKFANIMDNIIFLVNDAAPIIHRSSNITQYFARLLDKSRWEKMINGLSELPAFSQTDWWKQFIKRNIVALAKFQDIDSMSLHVIHTLNSTVTSFVEGMKQFNGTEVFSLKDIMVNTELRKLVVWLEDNLIDAVKILGYTVIKDAVKFRTLLSQPDALTSVCSSPPNTYFTSPPDDNTLEIILPELCAINFANIAQAEIGVTESESVDGYNAFANNLINLVENAKEFPIRFPNSRFWAPFMNESAWQRVLFEFKSRDKNVSEHLKEIFRTVSQLADDNQGLRIALKAVEVAVSLMSKSLDLMSIGTPLETGNMWNAVKDWYQGKNGVLSMLKTLEQLPNITALAVNTMLHPEKLKSVIEKVLMADNIFDAFCNSTPEDLFQGHKLVTINGHYLHDLICKTNFTRFVFDIDPFSIPEADTARPFNADTFVDRLVKVSESLSEVASLNLSERKNQFQIAEQIPWMKESNWGVISRVAEDFLFEKLGSMNLLIREVVGFVSLVELIPYWKYPQRVFQLLNMQTRSVLDGLNPQILKMDIYSIVSNETVLRAIIEDVHMGLNKSSDIPYVYSILPMMEYFEKYPEKREYFCASNPDRSWTIELMSADLSGTSVDAEQFMDVLCKQQPSTWFKTLVYELGISGQKLRSVFQNAMTILPLESEWYTEKHWQNSAPFNWTMLADNINVFINTLENMPPDFFPDFKWSAWKPVVIAFAKVMPEIVQLGGESICNASFLDLDFWLTQEGLHLLVKQLSLFDDYEKLLCDLPTLNVTSVYKILKEDFGIIDALATIRKLFNRLVVMDMKRLCSDCLFLDEEFEISDGNGTCVGTVSQASKALNLATDIIFSFMESTDKQINVQFCALQAIQTTVLEEFDLYEKLIGKAVPLLNMPNMAFVKPGNLRPLFQSLLDFIKDQVPVYVQWKDIAKLETSPSDESHYAVITNSSVNVNRLEQLGFDSSKLAYVFCSVPKLEKLFELPVDSALSSSDLVQKLCPNLETAQKYAKKYIDNIGTDAIRSNLSAWRSDNVMSWDRLLSMGRRFRSLTDSVTRVSRSVGGLDFSLLKNLNKKTLIEKATLLVRENTLDIIEKSLKSMAAGLEPYIRGSNFEDDLLKLGNAVIVIKDFLVKELANVSFSLGEILTDEAYVRSYMRDEVKLNDRTIGSLLNSQFNFTSMIVLSGFMTLEELLCDPAEMTNIVSFKDDPNAPILLTNSLCHYAANLTLSRKMADVIINNLDMSKLVGQFLGAIVQSFSGKANLTAEDTYRAFRSLRLASRALPEVTDIVRNFVRDINITELIGGLNPDRLALGEITAETMLGVGKIMCGHPIRTFVEYFKLLQDSSHQTDENRNVEELKSLPTSLCKRIYRQVANRPSGSIVWGYVKPILRGKILFAPNNELSRKIIQEANKTYADISRLTEMVEVWSEGFDKLGTFVENHLQDTEELLSLPVAKSVITGILGREQLFEGNLTISGTLQKMGNPQRYLSMTKLLVEGLECFETDRFIGYDTEEEMMAAAYSFKTDNNFMAGIVFEDFDMKRSKRSVDSNTGLPKHLKYKLRLDIDDAPSTKYLKEKFWKPGPEDNFIEKLRYLRGFVVLQDMIDQAFIRAQVGGTEPVQLPGTYVQQFPYPCYDDDDFGFFLRVNVPTVTTLAWIFLIAFFIRELVLEREVMLEQVMKMMGLRGWINWLSWFINCFAAMTCIVAAIVVIFKVGGIFPFTDWKILFFFLMDFAFALLMFCYLVSTFFTTATIASLTGVLLYLMSYLPFIIIMTLEPQLSFGAKILMNLVMSTSFSQGCLYLTRYEEQREGIQFSNLWSSPIPRDEMSFGWSCVMLGVDGVLYFLLALYFSYVLPTNALNGRRPWYFVFLPRYWKSGSRTKQNVYVVPAEGPLSYHDAILSGSSFAGNDLKKVEKDSREPVGISLHALRKVFNEGQTLEKVAVDRLTVDFFEGQITTLLGQNGAGKTTTINMLTGLSTPTSGSAMINGKDTLADAKASRKSLGICPQYNILFDLLTVREHLDFYGQLKGTLFGMQLKSDVDGLLESMGLWHKQDEVVCNLSGGMKRRVCVAIAFVGGSRTVILDEPTSGVDPVARRQIWDLIVKHKPGRTILLTTHYLDEADILSDRVAIMHAGKLLCIGSPLELKRKFGAGYHLAIGKHDSDYDSDTDSGAVSNSSSSHDITNFIGCDTEAIITFLQSHVPNADFEEETNTEVIFSLPYYKENGSLNTFDEVFFHLEKHQQRLGIERFGLSCTTLEEVFLNVCSQADAGLPIASGANKALLMTRQAEKLKAKIVERDQAQHNGVAMTTFSGFTSRQPLTGRSLKMSQLNALLWKRFYHARRDWRSFLTAVILPCIFVALAMGFSLVRPDAGGLSPSLRLTPALYGPDSTSFIKINENSSDFTRRAANAMLEPPGIGTSCLWTDSDDPLQKWLPTCAFKSGQTPPPAEQTNITIRREACRCDPQEETCAEKDYHFAYTAQATNTTDIVYNFVEGSLPDWIIATENKFTERRYGGWVFGAKPSSPSLPGQPESVIVWFNNKGHHAIPAYLNSLGNAMLRAHTGSDPNLPTEYGITAYSHPMHLSKMQLGMEALLHHVADVGISLVFLVAFSFIPASFIIYPVRERTREEKRLQFVSGVGPILYWSSAFFWDCLMLLVPVALSAIIIASFNQPVYVQNYNFIAVILLLFLYGWATTPLMYLLEKLFDEASLASMVLFCVNIFIGINTTVCVMLLYVFQSHPGMGEALGILRYLFLVFPQYAFCGGLFELTKSSIQAEVFMRFGHNSYVNPFSMDLLGINFIVLTLQGALFFALNIIFEFRPALLEPKFGKAKGMNPEEDDDVRLEKQKIHSNEGYGDMVRLKDLTKVYRGSMGKTLAVDKLCLGIPKGECFGLLGINGAGKTTTFRMLTGEHHPSDGEVLIKHQSVSDVLSNGHQIIGYCPQTNAIDDLLTADEMLYVYGKLRGVRSEDLSFVSHSLITKFNLQAHARRLTKTYSLGTKRKLCTAISVLGDPELVLMDEPTSGMDPSTRRLVWDNVLQIIKDKRSVILTSHSMEECDTLCTRLAIMVNGKLRCLGSPQYLKNKFGDGYTVTLRVHEEPQDWGHIFTFMRGFSSDAVLKAQHYNTVEFLVPIKNASLGEIFSQLESAKLNLGIDDFSVTQTTLDQVFVNFVREQADGLVNASLDLEEVSHSGNGHLKGQDMHLENEITFRNTRRSMPTKKINSFDSTAPIVRDDDYYEVTKF